MNDIKKDEPHVYAGNLSPEELRDWLNSLAESANKADSFGARAIDVCLDGMTAKARGLVGDLTKRVNFLQCREISRSEDHATAIQADLIRCQGILKSVSDFLRSVEQF